MAAILHLADVGDWRAAQAGGTYHRSTRGAALADVGFVHASTAQQLPAVAALVYGGVPARDLLLLVVDLHALEQAGVAVRWEAPPGEDQRYPHVYGALPVTSVRGGAAGRPGR